MNTENNVENAAVETAETTTATAPAERPERTFAPKNNPRRRRKVCPFCADKIDYIDYKDALRLRKFVSERAKILPRRVSGCCAKHQRQLTLAIKRARQVALLPYISDKRNIQTKTAVFYGSFFVEKRTAVAYLCTALSVKSQETVGLLKRSDFCRLRSIS